VNALRAAAPLHVAGRTLIPVERVWRHEHVHGANGWAALGREPVAVVIRDGDGVRAVDVMGEGVPLEALLETVEGLGEVLAG
jgi:uncharacterized spore protein YtfJ